MTTRKIRKIKRKIRTRKLPGKIRSISLPQNEYFLPQKEEKEEEREFG